MQVEKCTKFAQFDHLDELNDKVGDIKWSDIKYKSPLEKLDYWNEQYMTLTCEHAKMKILVRLNHSNPIFIQFSLIEIAFLLNDRKTYVF